MKKLLVLLPIFILLGTISVMAQGGQGGQGQGGQQGQAQFREQQKQRLKDSLSLTDAQIETVLNIQQEFQPQTREIRRDQAMSEADKETKLKAINEAKHKKLATELKDEALATKIDEFYARQMQGMRGGGGNRPRQ